MQWSGRSRTRVFGSILLSVVAAFVWLTPAPAAADELFATLTVSEVQEFLRLRPGHDLGAFRARLANASLTGMATLGLCTPTGVADCVIGIRASSRVNLQKGFTGPITGEIKTLIDNPTTPPPIVDNVLVVATTSFRGTIDLCAAPTLDPDNPCAPVGTAQGTWNSRDLRAHGTFNGLFQVPIPATLAGLPAGTCDIATTLNIDMTLELLLGPPVMETLLGHVYLNPLGSLGIPAIQCLTIGDFSLRVPMVRFSVELRRP